MRPDPRQRMWTVVRKLPPPVTAGDVEQLADVPAADVAVFLAELVAAGRLALRGDGYVLFKDHGPLAPDAQTLLPVPAAPSSPARPADAARDRAWAAMRRLRRFTRLDVADSCGCHPDVADDLVKLLARHGYLEFVGFKDRRKVMALVRDPGPIRPRTPQQKRRKA